MDAKSNELNSSESDNFAPEYRDRLRTWLIKMIHSETIPGLRWENDEKTIFRMPWKHAGRQDYNLEEDSKIFMAWAKHSGRYREGVDKPEPIVWKTRLRCALNKMPDIRELPDRSRLDISEPYRVYQLLPPVHKASQIRRRLYKRSQSQEPDHGHGFGEVGQGQIFKSGAFEVNGENWTKPISAQRRNSSIDTAGYAGKTSPQLLEAQALSSPRFWFSPPAQIPLKSSISPVLSTMHLSRPNPVPLDTAATSVGHSAYPLLPPFPTPFTFPPSTIPQLLTAAAPCFEAFRQQLTLAGQALAPGQRKEADTAFALSRNVSLEQVNAKKSLESVKLEKEDVIRHRLSKLAEGTDDIGHNPFMLHRKAAELEEVLASLKLLLGQNSSEQPERSTSRMRLDEAEKRIKVLERDLAESRTAHAREREAREKLEIEREKTKVVLEQMGDGIRSLAVRIHPRDEEMLSAFSRQTAIQPIKNSNDVSRFQKESELHSTQTTTTAFSDVTQAAIMRPHTRYFQVEPNRFVASQSPTLERHLSKDASSKRLSPSPLDLSVTSPTKRKRTSTEDSDTYWGIPSKSVRSSFSAGRLTSLSPCHSSDEKRSPTSPLSASSESSDYVTSNRKPRSTDPRSSSLSPPHRAGGLLQNHHQGTIQVS
ncbi:unnamed protein product [Clavelina lepadiformis]|uniref:IRF tryptophan pentad repeat domain-containing protein n=1 Tax=Clavelina lepadiformis TaxID=159417 RepID=A0ABP0EUT3_CLALP